MAAPKRKAGVDPSTMGSLFADHTTSRWKAPETFPQIRGKYKRIWVDFETNGTDWRGKDEPIGIVVTTPESSRYYPWGHRGGGNLDKNRVINWAQRELRDVEVGTAEGKFEIHMGKKVGIDFEAQNCQMREVQYAAALLSDQRRSFKIDDLAADWLGKRKLDIDRSRIWELPAAEVGPYAEQDGTLTKECDEYAEPLLRSEGLERVFKLENDLMFCVCEMERNGAPLDMEKLPRWTADAKRRYERAIIEVAETTGMKVNPNSNVELGRLADKLGIEYTRTATGDPSFTDGFMKTIADPNFQKLRMARALDSIHSKYLLKYLKAQRNGILPYKLHQLKSDDYGTISGRFSSSSVNIQQVYAKGRQLKKMPDMKDFIIRELFIAGDPDWEWLSADAMQIEFRLFAHYANSKRLNEAYANNPWIDFHDHVMAMLQRLVDIDRDDTKNVNFGKLFAMGRDKMRRQLDTELEIANELFDAYDQEFPEAKDLLNLSMKLARNRGYVKTLLGRRARFPTQDRLHSALNRVIQGTAADIMKLKLLEVYRNRKLLNFVMFFTVHDEVDGRVPKGGNYRERMKELLNTQIEELKLRVPIMWDVKTGDNWAACK
jgi:DNA polymerase-1